AEVAHYLFFFPSRRRHTRLVSDWSSDVCSSDLRPTPSSRTGLAAGDTTRTCAQRRRGRPGRLRGIRRRPVGTRRTDARADVLSKIGRASCREREQVWMDGGGLKKKQRGAAKTMW